MKIKRAYKYRLMLTKEEEGLCQKTAGSCRYVWNRALAMKKEAWEKDAKNISTYNIIKLIPSWKKELVWLKEVPSQTLQQVLLDLDKAYQNFFRRVKHGEKAGFPKYKKKGVHDSFRFPSGVSRRRSLRN